MRKKEIQQLIDQEIEWCRSNPPPPTWSKEYQAGFISGLIQANRIIEELPKAEKAT